jgi:flagellar basal-body rod protein FlgC
MTNIAVDQSPFRKEYDPGNPAADAEGFVKMPNVEPMIETLDMREAQRAYDANISVIETARNMDQRTLDLLKGQ